MIHFFQKTSHLVLYVCFFLLLSCHKKDADSTQIKSPFSDSSLFEYDCYSDLSEYTIPQEEAIHNFLVFLQNSFPQTKSQINSLTSINCISTIKSSLNPTQSDALSNNTPLAYILDFDNKSAIIGADYRAPGIFAILDQGHFNPKTFEYDFNPFFSESTQQSNETQESFRYILPEEIPCFISKSIIDCIEKEISSFSEAPTRSTTDIYYNGSWWQTDQKIDAMIETHWHQLSPYNDVISDLKGYPVYAGCVAIALSQLCTYYELPDSLSGVALDWPAIKNTDSNYNYYTISGSSLDQFKTSQFVGLVGIAAHTEYGEVDVSNGSSATDSDAMDALSTMGFTGIQRHTWANIGTSMMTYVNNSLWDSRPVYFAGNRRINLFRYVGHAWVLDGIWQLHNNSSQTMTLHHANFGYSGNHNGWYKDDIFKLSEEMVYEDTSIGDHQTSSSYSSYGYDYKFTNSAITFFPPEDE